MVKRQGFTPPYMELLHHVAEEGRAQCREGVRRHSP
jgi:hypothetical protein